MRDAEIVAMLERTGNLALAVQYQVAMETRKMRDWPLAVQGAFREQKPRFRS